ncbi:hypothetical protein HYN86_09775 [Flavobacterium fluviale]|uniref:Uncharacterized protein n=2 Tax=Flavobacterium fluviale TaxID=2249356 RepID=A0A344LSH1_9FLAO|nr:hypothetical protein HYN86_09775 [Flavobacterium fluviale]
MIQQMKISKFKKIVAIYLAMMILLETLQPMQMYALTGGPSQPEFESFTPIGTSDMVDLASGDFNYNIPIMDVGGYPLNLAYNSGVGMDQEASWVGLGWDLNVGQISRQLRGLPDDFDGDEMIYENSMKPNVTVGSSANVFLTAFGMKEAKASFGIGVKYNNYDGLGVAANGGFSYQISNNLSVGVNLESSASEGVSVSPNASFSQKFKASSNTDVSVGVNTGVTYNSRKGVESVTLGASASTKATHTVTKTNEDGSTTTSKQESSSTLGGASGSLSMNNASYSPTKRVGMVSSNVMFSANVEGEVWGVEGGGKFSGYRTSQGIKDSEKRKVEKAYGFENTYNAPRSAVLDFNREKDRTVNKNTTSLPITNNTYDVYSIQGQGISGMYRPYKSQVGYVYDNETNDDSAGGSLGLEFGAGGGVHFGVDVSVTIGDSRSALWSSSNPALGRFKEKKSNNRPDYEKVFFKNIGGFHTDKEIALFENQLGGYQPIKLNIEGGGFDRKTSLNYSTNKNVIGNTGQVARVTRLARNQTIEKLTKKEAENFGFTKRFNEYSKDNHTAEIKITKEGGDRYIYGMAAYNSVKKETTFDVSEANQYRLAGAKSGLIGYNPGVDNSPKNSKGGDEYFNRVTTPAYAHTYLLTSVLSSDYQDISNNGPSDDDLGTYTNFEYENKYADKGHNYRWRVPFEQNQANFDEGLRSSKKDNKANYLYGEKELLYIKKIVTKTHVAIFHLSERKDAFGVKDENGGLDDKSPTYKLDKISLYSKPEYLANGDAATPIKEAHFKYSYRLCQGVDNNINKGKTGEGIDGQKGKLTLEKVYFTYKNSKMGEYTPYVFNYASEFEINTSGYNLSTDTTNNPDYDMKAYDVWGNYKKVDGNVGLGTMSALSNAEYGYVDQKNEETADKNASVWLLKSIHLPSGGIMELNYESDDYSKVQNKDVMQMFKVVGSGSKAEFTASNINDSATPGKKDLGDYIYVELDHKISDGGNASVAETFYNKYLKTIGDVDNPIYFRFLLNMVNPDPKPGINETDKYDYVTGYMTLSKKLEDYAFNEFNGKQYVAIPLTKARKEDGFNGNKEVNPISKAGWGFGRKNLNRLVYSLNNEEDTKDLKGIITELVGWLPTLLDIFESPNKILEENGIASNFIAGKSWVRLHHPDSKKLGGGSRVKDIKIHDQWDVMTRNKNSDLYKQSYGQEYSYNMVDKDGNPTSKSSGVATYEPLGSKENPFVKPAYDKNEPELLLGPESDNYVEEPFGESFFPSPKVTYSRVTVKNLDRKNDKDPSYGTVVKKHATGNVVTEFYTSNDFPTIVDRTVMSGGHKSSGVLANLINLNVKDHLTMSQGYSIHTNDMDGKMKSQRVYGEGQTRAISGVDYNYNIVSNSESKNIGLLNNYIQTVDSKGKIETKLVGVDYDVINDFRENKTITSTDGVAVNVATLPFTLIVIVVPTIIPARSKHETQLRTAVTTKVIHTSAILSETVAYDLGSEVSTKNLAWDAETGDVLLKETVNEYKDKYYTFNFPAYWSYDGMSQAAKNAGLEYNVLKTGNNQYQFDQSKGIVAASDYLINGDEVWLSGKAPNKKEGEEDVLSALKGWVVNVNGSSFQLIDNRGVLIKGDVVTTGKIKIIRSGHRNMQMASMANVTSMRNPLYNYDVNNKITGPKDILGESPFLASSPIDRIVNAAAIEYSNEWPSQCECNLPKMTFVDGKLKFGYETETGNEDMDDVIKRSYNPYLYNVLGNWRANKSYAYLTGRNYTIDPTPRKTGYFTDFSPFYVFKENIWKITAGEEFKKWTFASQVTQFSPYGQEVENKDALNRYSAALYGYNNRFPVAVGSNTKYSELASDGFEDYDLANCGISSHFDFQGQLKLNEVSVSNKHSHTGRKSLKIEPNKKAVVKKQVVTCKPKSAN